MHDTGFEVRHEENLREHYAMTLAGWCANLDAHWAEAVAEVGEGTARVWRLYMAGSRLGFERNQIQLHQVLCVEARCRREVGHATAARLGRCGQAGRRAHRGLAAGTSLIPASKAHSASLPDKAPLELGLELLELGLEFVDLVHPGLRWCRGGNRRMLGW